MILKRLAGLVGLAAWAMMALPNGAVAKPAPKPNYIYTENGIYYYEAGISPQQREAGQVAGDAVGYRYYGTNANGEHVLARVWSNGAVAEFVYCKNPCRVIRTSGGERLVNNSRLLVNSVFVDAFRGRLRNTNPETQQRRAQTNVNIPARSPSDLGEGVTRTVKGIAIRSASGAPVYATADGIVNFAGQLDG